ncbi:MAG: DUF3990 domain-containing protein [Bacteroidetes bacterium]|nr:DUF3990 domain-containing protein [Bacteroidota bacterium]
MLVYHGGSVLIKEIDLQKCRPYTDFGRGFYVTKYKTHAENWARRSGKRHNNGFVTTFNYIESQFTDYICKRKKFDGYSDEWLDFIVNNRNEELNEQPHDFDIVEGPVANDKVQNRLHNYLCGEITKDKFLKELEYHEEMHQICFCTLASFQTLRYIENNLTIFIEQISEHILNSLIKEKGITVDAASDLFYSSKTFKNIADSTNGSYEQNWQDIYRMLQYELGLCQ